MDYWFMPSPSASDGGSDNTSVAAAAVWMSAAAPRAPGPAAGRARGPSQMGGVYDVV